MFKNPSIKVILGLNNCSDKNLTFQTTITFNVSLPSYWPIFTKFIHIPYYKTDSTKVDPQYLISSDFKKTPWAKSLIFRRIYFINEVLETIDDLRGLTFCQRNYFQFFRLLFITIISGFLILFCDLSLDFE